MPRRVTKSRGSAVRKDSATAPLPLSPTYSLPQGTSQETSVPLAFWEMAFPSGQDHTLT